MNSIQTDHHPSEPPSYDVATDPNFQTSVTYNTFPDPPYEWITLQTVYREESLLFRIFRKIFGGFAIYCMGYIFYQLHQQDSHHGR
jgi:hypothetical protein